MQHRQKIVGLHESVYSSYQECAKNLEIVVCSVC